MKTIKKKVYFTYLVQEFNAFVIEKSEKWWKPSRVAEKRDRVSPDYKDRYILAKSEDDAIKKYKERYKWKDFDGVISVWYEGFNGYPCVNKKNPDYKYTVLAKESTATLNKLMKEMRADEFLEYCRQEMIPIEAAITEK